MIKQLLADQKGRAATAAVGALATSMLAEDIAPISAALSAVGVHNPQGVALLIWAVGWLVDTIVVRRRKGRHDRAVRRHEQATRAKRAE